MIDRLRIISPTEVVIPHTWKMKCPPPSVHTGGWISLELRSSSPATSACRLTLPPEAVLSGHGCWSMGLGGGTAAAHGVPWHPPPRQHIAEVALPQLKKWKCFIPIAKFLKAPFVPFECPSIKLKLCQDHRSLQKDEWLRNGKSPQTPCFRMNYPTVLPGGSPLWGRESGGVQQEFWEQQIHHVPQACARCAKLFRRRCVGRVFQFDVYISETHRTLHRCRHTRHTHYTKALQKPSSRACQWTKTGLFSRSTPVLHVEVYNTQM